MTWLRLVLLALGVALLIGLVVRYDPAAVFASLRQLSWHQPRPEAARSGASRLMADLDRLPTRHWPFDHRYALPMTCLAMPVAARAHRDEVAILADVLPAGDMLDRARLSEEAQFLPGVQAPSLAMNPSLDPRVVSHAYAADESVAAAEYEIAVDGDPDGGRTSGSCGGDLSRSRHDRHDQRPRDAGSRPS